MTTSKASNWNPAKYPPPPREELLIEYDQETGKPDALERHSREQLFLCSPESYGLF